MESSSPFANRQYSRGGGAVRRPVVAAEPASPEIVPVVATPGRRPSVYRRPVV